MGVEALAVLGRRVLQEWGDDRLQDLVNAVPFGGVPGEMRT
jgi:hypothetical protein